MEYQLLSKLYYQNREEFDRMFDIRFNADSTIHLDFPIKSFKSKISYKAFVVLNNELMNLITDIYVQDKEIGILREKLADLALDQYIEDCLVEEVFQTNDIEGVNSSRKEIKYTLDNLSSNKMDLRFNGLVRKYLRLKDKASISLENVTDIRELYNELFMEEVIRADKGNELDGKFFREGIVYIKSQQGKIIHHGSYPESQIVDLLQQSLLFLNNDKINSLIRIAVFHYLFGYIHPFYDGNGRCARFISSYIISRYFEPLIGFRLSYCIKQNINKYYNAFDICNDEKNRGDLTPFVFTFLEIIKQACVELKNNLAAKSQQFDYYRKKLFDVVAIGTVNYNILLLSLIYSLFSEEWLDTKQFKTIVTLSSYRIDKGLKEMCIQGYMEMKKVGVKNMYRFNFAKFDEE